METTPSAETTFFNILTSSVKVVDSSSMVTPKLTASASKAAVSNATNVLKSRLPTAMSTMVPAASATVSSVQP